MVAVEYRNPNGTSVTVEASDHQVNSQGVLVLGLGNGGQVLLSPQTEWVVRDE